MIEPHRALIIGKTKCGKTKWILDLLESEYKYAFEVIIIICPTVFKNQTYTSRKWVISDPEVYLCDPLLHKLTLNECIDIYSKAFEGVETLFIIDDCVFMQDIRYRKDNCSLTKLVFSGRHDKHSVWLLTQKYNEVLKGYRDNTDWIALFYTKDKTSFNQVLDENDFTDNETRQKIKNHLRDKKYNKIIINTEELPVSYKLLTSNKIF
mgnify:CR=1 FL=1